MSDSVIGVLGVDKTRSQRDQAMIQTFSCNRTSSYNSPNPTDTAGVMGTNYEQRSVRDQQMISDFSCGGKESYQMLEPRSEKDMAMLRAYNPTVCKEQEAYRSQSQIVRDMNRQHLYEGYLGCPNARSVVGGKPTNCPYARMNYNPYNSSSNVQYSPLL